MIRYPRYCGSHPNNEETRPGTEAEAALIGLMDGKTQTEEIYALLLGRGFSLFDIHQSFERLRQEQLVADSLSLESEVLDESGIGRFRQQIESFAQLLPNASEDHYINLRLGLAYQERLRQSELLIVGDTLLASELERLGRQAGIGAVLRKAKIPKELKPGSSPFLCIYTADGFIEEEVLTANADCLQKKIAFLPAIHTGFGPEIGPLVIPGETACYACLLNRRKAVSGAGFGNSGSPLRLNFSMGAEVMALEAVKYLSGIAMPSLMNQFLQINILTGEYLFHPVLRLPRCPGCGVNKIKPNRKTWKELL